MIKPMQSSLFKKLSNDNNLLFILQLLALVLILLFKFILQIKNIDSNDLDVVAGDSGANAILIESAKNLNLFHGNYSRVGFYHPGPYFFQIQAISEIIFVDKLKIIKDIYISHALGLYISNIFLITFSAFAMSRIYKNKVVGVNNLFLCLFLISINDFGGKDWIGTWMPNNYIIPYMAFNISILSLFNGRLLKNFLTTRISYILCIFSGFILIHGHASFIGLVPLQILISLFLIEIILLKKDNKNLNLNNILFSLLQNNFKIFSSILFSSLFIFISFIMLLPIIIESFYNFPGQVPFYFSFTESSEINNIFESIIFLFKTWPGGALGTFFFIILILNYFQNFKLKINLSLKNNLYVLTIPSTIVILFYTVKGIDNLNDNYLIYYYTSIYALSVSTTLIFLVNNFQKIFEFSVPYFTKANSLILFSFLCSYFLGIHNYDPYIHRELNVKNLYNNLNNRTEINYLSEHSHNGWVLMNGVFANEAVNKSPKDICISPRNYNISFKSKNKCDSDLINDKSIFLSKKNELNGINVELKNQIKIKDDFFIGNEISSISLDKDNLKKITHSTSTPLEANSKSDVNKYLHFGPYLTLKEGKYKLEINYRCDEANSCGFFDVVTDFGNILFAKSDLQNTNNEFKNLNLFFVIKNDALNKNYQKKNYVNNLELRSIYKGGNIKINNYSLEYLD